MTKLLRLGGALIILVLALVLLIRSGVSAQYTLAADDYATAQTLFERDIRELGGTKAYERFSVAVEHLPNDDQHGYAHLFGGTLYGIEGDAGVSACDTNFGLGCFHQFLGDAITELGTSSIPRLYDGCARATGARDVCEHGIGHGILASAGYELRDLREALALCDAVAREKPLSGCKGGVFMEYNMRTIAQAEGISTARPAASDLHAPCNALDREDSRICVFWLPQWWYFSVMQPHNDESFSQVGRLCAVSRYPQTCYEGMGYIAPTAFGLRHNEVIRACDSIQNGGDLYCRAMASLIFNITPETRGTAPELCRGLAPDKHSVCMQYAEHDRDFSFTVAPSVMDE